MPYTAHHHLNLVRYCTDESPHQLQASGYCVRGVLKEHCSQVRKSKADPVMEMVAGMEVNPNASLELPLD